MTTFHFYSPLLPLPTTSPSFKTLIPLNGNSKFLSSPRHSSPSSFLCFSSKNNPSPSADNNTSNFCIIEGPETVRDFGQMQLQEIEDNIRSRRNRIFLLMEEVRRLRIQQRIKNVKVINENGNEEIDEMPDIPSSIPFLSYVTPKTMKQLYFTSLAFISGIIVFGGLIAPTLELKLGLGGTSYEDFIRNMHLPLQLSQVDPIVADSEDESEEEEKEEEENEEEENENGITEKSEDEMPEDSESEEKNETEDESEEEVGKKKKSTKVSSSKKESAGKATPKKVTVPKRSSTPQKRTPKTSSKSSKVDDDIDKSPKVSSRKKTEKVTKEKSSTPTKSASKEKTSKKVAKGKDKAKEEKLKPSDHELRDAICEILKEVDFNTATFTDILKLLARQFDTDLTPRKSSIKLMIQEELTKLADEADDEDGEGDAEKDENQSAGQEVEA